jgi:hypothetical protein
MSDQKNWDASVIKTWRTNGNIVDAMSLFKALSGKQTDQCDPPLKRLPPSNYPWKVSMKVFVADHLSKISKRLWEQTPDKDILLLRKLETSPYDTEQEKILDRDLINARRQTHTNRKRNGMNTLSASNRNQATDWGVTKGSVKIRRRK